MATGEIRITVEGLEQVEANQAVLGAALETLLTKVDQMATDLAALTTKVNGIADQLQVAIGDIRGDIANLKAAGVDPAQLEALEASVDRLGAVAGDATSLAAENPPPA